MGPKEAVEYGSLLIIWTMLGGAIYLAVCMLALPRWLQAIIAIPCGPIAWIALAFDLMGDKPQ